MKSLPIRSAAAGIAVLALSVVACTSSAGTTAPSPSLPATVAVSSPAASAVGTLATASPSTAAVSSVSVVETAPPTVAPGVIFALVEADGTTVNFLIADLNKLPLVSIMSDGKPQEGPAVLAVLQSAGVTDFSTLTFWGIEGSKTMTKAQIDGQVILDFNNRGKVKLVSPTMVKADRITDVDTIVVK